MYVTILSQVVIEHATSRTGLSGIGLGWSPCLDDATMAWDCGGWQS